jgi:hypothetical protein
MMDEEKKRELLMRVIDGVADERESAELDGMMADDPVLRDEYVAMKKIKEVTDAMQFKEMPDSFWDGYWNGIYNRLERGLGWGLFSIGLALVSAFAVFRVFQDFFLNGAISIAVRGGVLIGAVGALIILWSIFREVVFARRHERYKEIKR